MYVFTLGMLFGVALIGVDSYTEHGQWIYAALYALSAIIAGTLLVQEVRDVA